MQVPEGLKMLGYSNIKGIFAGGWEILFCKAPKGSQPGNFLAQPPSPWAPHLQQLLWGAWLCFSELRCPAAAWGTELCPANTTGSCPGSTGAGEFETWASWSICIATALCVKTGDCCIIPRICVCLSWWSSLFILTCLFTEFSFGLLSFLLGLVSAIRKIRWADQPSQL